MCCWFLCYCIYLIYQLKAEATLAKMCVLWWVLRIVSISVSVIELLQAGSVSLFLGPADGLHSHSLLLDEEKGRLLLGTRDHVYLLDPDNLSRTPRKVRTMLWSA